MKSSLGLGVIAALILGVLAVAGAQQLRSKEFGRPRLDDRPKLRDRDWVKRGQLPPGRRGRWARTGESDYGGTWSDDLGWLAPPETMGEETLSAYRADVRQGESAIQSDSTSANVPPINWNGVIYVSCRDYFSAAGTTAYWAETIRSAVAKLPDGRAIVLPLNQGVVYIDGKATTLAHPSVPVNDVMMVPLRDLSDALGFTIQWDPERKLAILVPPAAPPTAPAEKPVADEKPAAEKPAAAPAQP